VQFVIFYVITQKII